jgi:hypothetical protein
MMGAMLPFRPVHRLARFAAAALCAAFLATAAHPAERAASSFSAERFRAHVTFLADDLLEGRDIGSRGHEIAARYVASQFAASGLTPAGDAGSWFQSITFQESAYTNEAPVLTIEGPSGARTWIHGGPVVIRLPALKDSVTVEAPLVFVGYGIENERLKIDDYRGLDVQGKIVVALVGFPRGLPSEEGAHLNATKAQVAQRHGAVGLLQVDTLQSQKAIPWKMRLEYAREPY